MHTAYGYAHALIESCVRIQMFGTRESTKGLALVIVRHPPHARKTKNGAVSPFQTIRSQYCGPSPRHEYMGRYPQAVSNLKDSANHLL